MEALEACPAGEEGSKEETTLLQETGQQHNKDDDFVTGSRGLCIIKEVKHGKIE